MQKVTFDSATEIIRENKVMKSEKLIALIKDELTVNIHQLKHLQFEKINGAHVISLVDTTGHKILSGYGKTVIAAINDLHNGLL